MKQKTEPLSANEEKLRKECRNLEAALYSTGYTIEQIKEIRETGCLQLRLSLNSPATDDNADTVRVINSIGFYEY